MHRKQYDTANAHNNRLVDEWERMHTEIAKRREEEVIQKMKLLMSEIDNIDYDEKEKTKIR